MRLSKILVLSSLLSTIAWGGINSNTDMSIAVGKINPYITSNMNALEQKIEVLVTNYKKENHATSEERNIHFQRFSIMDKEIALTLREIKMLDQELVELRKANTAKGTR